MSFGGVDWREEEDVDYEAEAWVPGLILIALVMAGIVYALVSMAGGRLW